VTVCIRCHRPLSRPTETGMGPVCAKAARARAVEAVERDLFGYDLDKAVRAAQDMVGLRIMSSTAAAHAAIRHQFRAARAALLGWQA
jgi:hypothetical protein